MKNKIILVIGMHRSGTSIITKSLECLNVPIGSNFIETIRDVNLHGFFEDKDFNDFNKKLLTYNKQSWYQTSKKRIENLKFSKKLIKEAEELIHKKIKNNILALKDPACTLLIRFWVTVFENCGIDFHIIYCLRNPSSISKSLEKRDHFDIDFSLLLTNFYHSNFLDILETKEINFTVIEYESFLNNPKYFLKKLSDNLNLTFNNKKFNVLKKAFINKNLNHHISDKKFDSKPLNNLSIEIFNIIKNLCNNKKTGLKELKPRIDLMNNIFDYFLESSTTFINEKNIQHFQFQGIVANKNDEFNSMEKQFQGIVASKNDEFNSMEKQFQGIVASKNDEFNSMEKQFQGIVASKDDQFNSIEKQYLLLCKDYHNSTIIKNKEYKLLENKLKNLMNSKNEEYKLLEKQLAKQHYKYKLLEKQLAKWNYLDFLLNNARNENKKYLNKDISKLKQFLFLILKFRLYVTLLLKIFKRFSFNLKEMY